ncbi:MAG: hypothetical protein AAFV53_20185 [Myxococcota bacterium]
MSLPDLEACIQARRAAEERGDDAALLQWRRLERAHGALPPLIDDARCTRLLWADPISTVWLGWSVRTGERLLIRCLRPAWRADPVMLRRLARAAMGPHHEALCYPTWRGDSATPHLRLALPGPLILDAAPLDSHAQLAAIVAALNGLAVLHDQGTWLGADLADHVCVTPDGPRMVWLDRFAPAGAPTEDLAAVGQLAEQMGAVEGSVCALAVDWQDAPPPDARSAGRLLQGAMSGLLLRARHRLIAERKRLRLNTARRRLHHQVAALADVARPPQGPLCVQARPHQPLIIAVGEGNQLRGGEGPIDALPVILSSSGVLDVSGARGMLRALRGRRDADEPRRCAAQARLGAGPTPNTMIRWLTARLQLRSLLLLMEKTQTRRGA